MAIPFQNGHTTQQTASRSTKTFIMGKGAVMSPSNTLATSPDTTTAGKSPPAMRLLGADQVQQSQVIPAMANGSQMQLSVNAVFRNLLSTVPIVRPAITGDRAFAGNGGVSVRTGDSLVFIVSMSITQTLTNSPIWVVNQFVQPVASGAEGNATGPNLPAGRSYTGFSAVGSVNLYAYNAYSGNSTLMVYATGSLYLQQG